MNIFEVKERSSLLIEQLLKVWEKSVKATYQYLIVLEKENLPIAFMGLEKQKLEMLFIAPKERGQGLGKKLMQYGIENFSINELTVNEQGNPYPLLYMKLN